MHACIDLHELHRFEPEHELFGGLRDVGITIKTQLGVDTLCFGPLTSLLVRVCVCVRACVCVCVCVRACVRAYARMQGMQLRARPSAPTPTLAAVKYLRRDLCAFELSTAETYCRYMHKRRP